MAEPPIEHRFKPGGPGGPGRPPGRLTAKLVAKLAATEVLGKELPKGRTVEDQVVEVVTAKAIAGDFRFARMLWERIEGKVALPLVGPDGGPVMGGPAPPDPALIAQAMRIYQAHERDAGPTDGGDAGEAPLEPAPADPEATGLPGP